MSSDPESCVNEASTGFIFSTEATNKQATGTKRPSCGHARVTGDARSTQAQLRKRLHHKSGETCLLPGGKMEQFPVLSMALESGVTPPKRRGKPHEYSHRAPNDSRPVRFLPPSSSGINASKRWTGRRLSSIQGSVVGESRQSLPDTFAEGRHRCLTSRRPISGPAASRTQPSRHDDAFFHFCATLRTKRFFPQSLSDAMRLAAAQVGEPAFRIETRSHQSQLWAT